VNRTSAVVSRIELLGDPKNLWYLNRASGLVLLVLLTVVIVFGVMTSRKAAGGKLPRFVSNEVHRFLAFAAVAFLGLHVTTAVLDDFVQIDWWNVVIPWGSGWKPLWIAFGAVAVDLLVVVVITSLLRDRIPERQWRALHLTVFLMWPIAWIHALGAGTDAKNPIYLVISVLCAITVAAAAAYRWFKPAPTPIPVQSTTRRQTVDPGSR